jgi:hypothetical protein
MGGESERRLPVVGVVVVCFLIGFAGIGTYRWLGAQPVPLPPMGGADESPFKALPAPTLPPPSMPVVAPAGSVDPPELPKPVAVTAPDLPKPTGRELLPPPTTLPVEPAPVPPLPKPAGTDTPVPLPKPVTLEPAAPLPKPAETIVPLPKPAAVDTPVPLPKPADTLPAPVTTEVPKLPPPAEVIPPPRAVDTPALPAAPLPGPTPAVTKPDFNLRPDTPPLTLNPKEIPPPQSDLPPPRTAVPASRPAIDATTTSSVRTPGTLAPGDAPMKHLFLSAVIGAAVAGTAPMEAFAQDPAKPGEKEVTLKDLDKKVKDLTDELATVKKKKDDLEKLVNGSADGKALTPTEKGLVRRVEELEALVTTLKGKIETLEKAGAKSVSEKAPLPTVLAGKGKVVLVNEFRTRLSIIVNKTSHPLDPNEMKEVVVPEGELNYELVEFPNAAPVKSTIKEGETVTLRIK